MDACFSYWDTSAEQPDYYPRAVDFEEAFNGWPFVDIARIHSVHENRNWEWVSWMKKQQAAARAKLLVSSPLPLNR
jgi:hypothetical protein